MHILVPLLSWYVVIVTLLNVDRSKRGIRGSPISGPKGCPGTHIGTRSEQYVSWCARCAPRGVSP